MLVRIFQSRKSNFIYDYSSSYLLHHPPPPPPSSFFLCKSLLRFIIIGCIGNSHSTVVCHQRPLFSSAAKTEFCVYISGNASRIELYYTTMMMMIASPRCNRIHSFVHSFIHILLPYTSSLYYFAYIYIFYIHIYISNLHFWENTVMTIWYYVCSCLFSYLYQIGYQ